MEGCGRVWKGVELEISKSTCYLVHRDMNKQNGDISLILPGCGNADQRESEPTSRSQPQHGLNGFVSELENKGCPNRVDLVLNFPESRPDWRFQSVSEKTYYTYFYFLFGFQICISSSYLLNQLRLLSLLATLASPKTWASGSI